MDLEQVFAKFERQSHLDMKLNFKKFFLNSGLSPKEAGLVALCSAETAHCPPLVQFTAAHLRENDTSDDEISEAKDMAAVMGVANCYYRFRHYVEKDAYRKPAGFRMSLMAKPQIGKLNLEMCALAASIINGCESCVQGHEKSVLEHGGTEEKVHDIARLSSTIKGLSQVFRQFRKDT